MAGTSNTLSKLEDQIDKDDKGLTMLEVLEDEADLEEDANAVLGGSDDVHCTYSRGYMKRQPLYACMTCTKAEEGKRGGVCLACSYHCHEEHELVELYTKRNFKCDCGNSNFPNKCSLEQDKDPQNEGNSYNDNFRGLYCSCKRPYPDPDDEADDEMMQCIVCEDWYHGRHLGSTPPNDNYAEMICSICMDRCPFLNFYIGYSVFHEKADDTEVSGSQNTDDVSTKSPEEAAKDEDGTEMSEGCKLKKYKAIASKGATFWGEGWRKILCTCLKCQDMYRELKVVFLTDKEDPVQVYEEEAKSKESGSQYEEGLRALSSLGHVQKVEAIQEYNLMQEQLKDYLKKFADNKKVVREEDIRAFFSEMESRKKRRVDAPLPHFCH